MIARALNRVARSRYVSRARVERNHRAIARLANETGALDLAPIPAPYAGGRTDRYYHFVFDFLLPLSRLARSVRPGVTLGIPDLGPLRDVAVGLFGDGSHEAGVADRPTGRLMGMTPTHVYLSRTDARTFVQDIFERAQVERAGRADTILLIERIPPSDYYRSSDHRPGGGASRRSILNHAEVGAAIRSQTRAPHAVHEVRLETMSFRDQLRAFDSAAVVIGQHGAGLSNALWMRPGSVVLELDHRDRRHFERVSALRGHRHARYHLDGPHVAVEPENLARWVAAQCEGLE